MLPVGRPYNLWRDWMMAHANETKVSQLLWDSLPLLSFQVPIYAGIIAFSGASGGTYPRDHRRCGHDDFAWEALRAFLNLLRRMFGLPPGGVKAMSLNS